MPPSSSSNGPFSPFAEPFKEVITHVPSKALQAGKEGIENLATLPFRTAKQIMKKSLGIVGAIAKNLPIFPGPNENIAKQLIHLRELRGRSETGTLFANITPMTRERIEEVLQETQQT